jgi:hypothetical protein
MSTRTNILLQIRHEHRTAGLAAALRITRAAFEANRIDRLDIPEVLLALRSGSWQFFEDLGRLPGGNHRHTGHAA